MRERVKGVKESKRRGAKAIQLGRECVEFVDSDMNWS